MNKTTEPDYPDFVTRLCKPGRDILAELTPHDAHALHMAIGVSGEAGELLDAVKKSAIYRKPLDIKNVIEEAGDILFYLTGLLDSIGVTLEECVEKNIDKLSLRYQSLSFSNAQAIARADKNQMVRTYNDKPPYWIKKMPDVEDGFENEKITICRIDDPECESCQ